MRLGGIQRTKEIIRRVTPPEARWAVRRWAARAAHYGTRRYCPCCRSHLRAFASYGDRPRPDALCPVCGALERHRLASLFLDGREDLLGGLRRILHVAPEPPVARLLQNFAEEAYVSVDLSPDGVAVQADLTRMPFPSQSFDCVYCSHVLEHVPEDGRAMAELHRVLRPGGWALIQVPVRRERTIEDPAITSPDRRRELFGQPDHVRVYGRDVGDRLRRARFAVQVEQPQHRLDRATVGRCGLSATEQIFLCRKESSCDSSASGLAYGRVLAGS